MDRNFAGALSLLPKHEGGWIDHPSIRRRHHERRDASHLRSFVKPGRPSPICIKSPKHRPRWYFRDIIGMPRRAPCLPIGFDCAAFDCAVNSGLRGLSNTFGASFA